MSELQKAFPPIETGDNVPAVCLAVAILGLVLGGLVVAARMYPAEAQVTITMSAPTLPPPGSR
jgi:tetrahydromethanopterin S-methyltransferase subunit D